MLTLNDLREHCPAVFAEHPHPDVTTRYEFMPTLPIVEDMLQRGWVIRSARQNGKDDPYASHRIVFDPPNAPRFKDVGDVFPTATLINSHNRTRKREFLIGFFRTVCSNQAQVSVLSHGTTRVHIVGYGFDSTPFLDTALRGFEDLPTVFKAMSNRVLTPAERQTYGKQVCSIRRYNDTSLASLFTPEGASEILTPRRQADNHMDLWHTFNVAQENVMHGSSRGINEVRRNANLNLALWNAAKAFLN